MKTVIPLALVSALACGARPESPTLPDPVTRPAPSASQLEAIELSPEGACGRLEGGTATCWGSWGGAMIKVSGPAVELTDVIDLRIGHDFLQEPQQSYHDHLCALTGKTVQCWGNGEQRQIGADSRTSSPTPTTVSGIPAVTQLALGARHSCALSEDQEPWCWGGNKWGQIGAGRGRETIPKPTKVGGLGKVTLLATSTLDTCALTADHEVYCWGDNLGGEAGAENVSNPVVWSPRRVEIASGSRQVAGGYSTFCALKLEGKIVCWGYLESLLGAAFEKSLSGEVPDVHDAVAIAVGYSHACAVRQDQTVWCWGKNDAGQLGDGSSSDSSAPATQVNLPGRATAVVAASKSTCAHLEDRRWFCWGDNRNGQIGPRGQPMFPTPAALDLSQVELASQ